MVDPFFDNLFRLIHWNHHYIKRFFDDFIICAEIIRNFLKPADCESI